jgi:hypothetical protein
MAVDSSPLIVWFGQSWFLISPQNEVAGTRFFFRMFLTFINNRSPSYPQFQKSAPALLRVVAEKLELLRKLGGENNDQKTLDYILLQNTFGNFEYSVTLYLVQRYKQYDISKYSTGCVSAWRDLIKWFRMLKDFSKICIQIYVPILTTSTRLSYPLIPRPSKWE